MARYTWACKVREGMLDEYIRRHDEIWPEMTQMLNEAGVHNYTIWNMDDLLFGYYECEDLEYALKFQAKSEVNRRWSKYMQDVLITLKDPVTGEKPIIKQVFLHE